MRASLGMKFSALRRRMRKDAIRGSAAIEFAFIAPVFFLMLFAIIETGIMYFSQFTLQNAVLVAARQIRTGQAPGSTAVGTDTKCTTNPATTGPYTSGGQWFSDQICCGISALLDCSNLHVTVQNYSGGFGGTAFTNPTDASGHYLPATDTYNPGNACDVVLVRATYTWTVFTPVLTWFLVNMTGNGHLLVSTTAFRNEPYGSALC